MVVVEFIARYPDVQVELVLHDRVSNLIEEGFDIAVRIGDLRESSYLVARRLLPYRMLICASPSYISRHGRPVVPSDLAHHNCLNHLLWTQETGWHSFTPPTDVAGSLGGQFSSNNGHALRNAAIAGCGIVMLPHALLWQDVQENKLVTLLNDFLPPPRPVHLLYPYDRQQLPKVARLVDMLVERIGDGCWEPDQAF
jgi:DNA-binding transcriptional LysR family regulator